MRCRKVRELYRFNLAKPNFNRVIIRSHRPNLLIAERVDKEEISRKEIRRSR